MLFWRMFDLYVEWFVMLNVEFECWVVDNDD